MANDIPTRITLDLAPLRDFRIFAVGHMRKLVMSLHELNQLAATLPDDHPIHDIAHQVREVVRCSLFADEGVYQIAKRQPYAEPAKPKPRKRPAHLKLVANRPKPELTSRYSSFPGDNS